MLFRYLLLTLCALPLCLPTYAQPILTGIVVGADEQPLPTATVLLVAAIDSALVKGAITDVNGHFAIEVPTEGRYRIRISMVGFQTYVSAPLALTTAGLHLGTIALAEGVELQEIVVQARQPLFVQEADRIRINVADQAAFAGGSALDVLSRSPGVDVNEASSIISILGKDGVNIMLNGKVTYLPTDAVLTYLSGLSADTIQRIELLTNPPASLDAEGNAGFINIVLKSNPDDGTNGAFSAAGGYGQGSVGSVTINLNARKRTWNVYGTYGYVRNAQDQFTRLTKRIPIASDMLHTHVFSDRTPTQNNHSIRLGIDHQLSDQTLAGLLISGYTNHWDMKAQNQVRTGLTLAGDTLIAMNNAERNDWSHVGGNANIQHRVAHRAILTLDANMLRYANENPVMYGLTYTDDTDRLLSTEQLESVKETSLNIAVIELNYTHSLSDVLSGSIGGKIAASRFTNDVHFRSDGITDSNLSSSSELEESIYGGFVHVDYQPHPTTTLKAGLRYEYTDSELTSAAHEALVDREFGRLFPSFAIAYTLRPSERLTVGYTRRITRPTFRDMAPFVIFLDPSTYFSGNAGLQPATAHTLQAGYQRKAVNTSLQYTFSDDAIARFQNTVLPGTNTQLIISSNLENQKIVTGTVAFPIVFHRQWTMNATVSYVWQQAKTTTSTIVQSGVRLNGNQQLILSDAWTLSLTGFYQTPSLVGSVRFDAFGGLTVGVQRSLKQSRLSLALTDTFDSIKRVGTTEDSDAYIQRSFDFSHPTVRLMLSTPFGNAKLKRARPRNSAAEERQRAN